MRGSAPRRENDFAGLGAPHPDMRNGFYGAPPQTPLGDFFGKKSPRPEKTGLDRFQAIKYR